MQVNDFHYDFHSHNTGSEGGITQPWEGGNGRNPQDHTAWLDRGTLRTLPYRLSIHETFFRHMCMSLEVAHRTHVIIGHSLYVTVRVSCHLFLYLCPNFNKPCQWVPMRTFPLNTCQPQWASIDIFHSNAFAPFNTNLSADGYSGRFLPLSASSSLRRWLSSLWVQ